MEREQVYQLCKKCHGTHLYTSDGINAECVYCGHIQNVTEGYFAKTYKVLKKNGIDMFNGV